MSRCPCLAAKFARVRAGTPGGAKLAPDNRREVREATDPCARAERAGNNGLENLPLLIGFLHEVRRRRPLRENHGVVGTIAGIRRIFGALL